jgi:TonB family protein
MALNRSKGTSHVNSAVFSSADNAYISYLRQCVWLKWLSPKGHQPPLVVVSCIVDRNGNPNNLNIKKSSGDAEADNAALEAIKNAAPFKPLPSDTNSTAEIQFTFWHRDSDLESNEGIDVSVTFKHS